VSLCEWEHYKENIYRRRHEYKGKMRWRYSVKTICAFCGNAIYQDRANNKRHSIGYCGAACKSAHKKKTWKVRSNTNAATR